MSNILTALPAFDLSPFTHLLPSLERASISTADLLTLDALDVAKRAQVPPGELRKLVDALLRDLHRDVLEPPAEKDGWSISTLDEDLDAMLDGGIACGQLTEIVGESAAGKTQFMLTLLLSAQLADPAGERNAALYISTEAPLQTNRLAQILSEHPRLAALSAADRPSLSRVHSTHVHDLEAQDHILRFQVPIAIETHRVALVVVDSIAANYRAEFDKSRRPAGGNGESLAKRSADIAQMCALLRDLARKHHVAVVVTNQVADRFTTLEFASASQTQALRALSQVGGASQPPPPAQAQIALSTDDPLALDHQQRFTTGWGDDVAVTNLKTPTLGLALTNQLAARIALLKTPVYAARAYAPGEEREVERWSRTCRVVFSAWCAPGAVEYEIWRGGVRSLRAVEEERGRDDER